MYLIRKCIWLRYCGLFFHYNVRRLSITTHTTLRTKYECKYENGKYVTSLIRLVIPTLSIHYQFTSTTVFSTHIKHKWSVRMVELYHARLPITYTGVQYPLRAFQSFPSFPFRWNWVDH